MTLLARFLMTQSAGSPVNLASYTPDTGAGTMTFVSGTGDIKVRSGTGSAYSDADDTPSYHQYSVALSTADGSITAVSTADVSGASLLRIVSLALRWQAGGAYYRAAMPAGGAATIGYFDGSSETNLSTSGGNAWAIGDTATWKFEVVGTTLTLYKNGASFLTATSSSISAAGKAGLPYQRNVTYDQIDIDDTASVIPVLTSPATPTVTGSQTATVGATTDTGSGTLYCQVLPAADAAPSAATIIGATGAGTGSVAVSSTGAKTINITGLTAATAYKAHFAQTGPSNVVSSASFTTEAAPVITGPLAGGGRTHSTLTQGRLAP